MTLPGSDDCAAEDPVIHKLISDWLDMPCRLDPASETQLAEFEMSFNFEHPDTDVFSWTCPPGTFTDWAAAHLLTTASLAAAAVTQPAANWDVRRFRPTVLVDTGRATGFVEDTWLGHHLRLGASTLVVDMPTARCPFTTRAQPDGLTRDLSIAASLRDHHDNNLGVYASVTDAGLVAVGDPLQPVEPSPT